MDGLPQRSSHRSQPACVICKSQKSLKHCGRCKTVWYCGTHHQKSHWPFHQKDCKPQPVPPPWTPKPIIPDEQEADDDYPRLKFPVTPETERKDTIQLPPSMYPRSTQDLDLIKRLGERPAPTPHNPFYGTTGTVHLAKLRHQAGQKEEHKIALKIIYSFSEFNEFIYEKHELKIHQFLCSIPGSQKFIVQFYTHWTEKLDYSSVPDWNADKNLTNNPSMMMAFEYIPMNLIQFRNSTAGTLQTLNEAEIYFLVFQVARGIEFLQNNHVVHRDIKADNILVDECGRALISDFGSAHIFEPHEKFKKQYFPEDQGFSKGGATMCLPPEILKTNPGKGVYLDYSKTDIYALGILIYVVAGQEPPGDFGDQPPMIPGWFSKSTFRDILVSMVNSDITKRWTAKKVINTLSISVCAMNHTTSHEVLKKNPELQLLAKTNAKQKVFQEKANRSKFLADREVAHEQVMTGMNYKNGMGVEKDLTRAFDYFFRAAQQGHPVGQSELGQFYYYGLGDVKENKQEAIKWFEMAAEQGDQSAQYNLASIFELDKDETRSFKYFRDTAENKRAIHPAAIYNTAVSYIRGEGTKVDRARGIQLLQQGADQADPPSLTRLGDSYANGIGVPKDIESGIACYRRAAEQGYAEAQWEIGRRYLAGEDGLEKDEALAIRYLSQSAGQGYQHALVDLGYCYARGIGVAKDPMKAVDLFQQAIERDSRASYHLGMCYLAGEGVLKDEKKALDYFFISVDKGYNAHQQIGLIYKLGAPRVPKDDLLAMKHLEISADEGNLVSQELVGIHYLTMSYDKPKAEQYLRMGAEQGSIACMFSLGELYDRENDRILSREYFKKAADLGNSEGQNNYGLGCLQDGKIQEAYHYLELAAHQGNELAQSNLGDYYRKGVGVPKNDELAMKYYHMAAEKGEPDAKIRVEQFTKTGAFQEKTKLQKPIKNPPGHDLFLTGVTYIKGDGVPEDTRLGNKYLEQAAEKGHVDAQFALALYYLEDGKDEPKAVEYLLASASRHPRAALQLGHCYAEGRGVKENKQKAMGWFQKAADAGQIEAQVMFGFWKSKPGPEKDAQKAKTYLLMAAEKGHVVAQFLLGGVMRFEKDQTKDLEGALKWWTLAADNGHHEAQFYLGDLLIRNPTFNDPDKGMKYMKLAADANEKKAIFYLGCCFFNSERRARTPEEEEDPLERELLVYFLFTKVQFQNANPHFKKLPKNDEISYQYFLSASKQGAEEANYFLGIMNFQGIGCPKKNEKLGCRYFLKAAQNGCQGSQFCLAVCYRKGRGVKKDKQMAFELFKAEADRSERNHYAKFEVGSWYYRQEKMELAVKYLKPAADAGHWEAPQVLAMALKALGQDELALKYFRMGFMP